MRATRLVFSVMVAVAAVAASRSAEATIIFDNGQIPGGHGENLVGNHSQLADHMPTVQGATNQTHAVLDIINDGSSYNLDITGGQAIIHAYTGSDPKDGVPLGNFSLMAHSPLSDPPAVVDPMFVAMQSFWEIEFAITPEQKVGGGYVQLKAYDGATLLATSGVFPVAGNSDKRFHIYTDTPLTQKMTKISVLTSKDGMDFSTSYAFISDIKQIRLDGVNGERVVVPEPTSIALAGFAGLGMAVGAWRRRRQQAA